MFILLQVVVKAQEKSIFGRQKNGVQNQEKFEWILIRL